MVDRVGCVRLEKGNCSQDVGHGGRVSNRISEDDEAHDFVDVLVVVFHANTARAWEVAKLDGFASPT